ncbi:17783_t:CDS:2, partial [Acaulospora morrowiae]
AFRLRRSLDYLLESDCSEDVRRNVEKLKKGLEAILRRGKTHITTVGIFALPTLWSSCPLLSAGKAVWEIYSGPEKGKEVGIFWDKIEDDLIQFCLDQSLAGNEARVILNQIKLGILSDRKKSKRKATSDTEKDDTDASTSPTKKVFY